MIDILQTESEQLELSSVKYKESSKSYQIREKIK